ncbi:MAG: deoxyribose-phosphate aldolase [Elusimicrobia bacterium]|nr:deoxyribose-phosphate aldolase [Elusimicrobiota bacterium]
MADENFIQKVTRETINRLKGEDASAKNVLLIFMGGDREVETSLKQVRCLRDMGMKFRAFLTPAAERIIGKQKVQEAGGCDIATEKEMWDRGFVEKLDAVIVPVLTLNGASKIANMLPDNAASNLILMAMRYGKKIIMARDSVLCCNAPEPPVTSLYMRRINEYINTIKNLGAEITLSRNLAKKTAEIMNLRNVVPVGGETARPGACPGIESCAECGLCVINRKDEVKSIIDAGASRISSKQVTSGVPADVARLIDHTNLKADATQEQIGKLCEEAKKYKFATVCVNPTHVKMASELLKGSGVGVTTVIGFPLGATTPTVKAIEARDAIANGADEIDMVLNVGALKGGNYRLVEDDIKAVREATRGKILKVILETALLSKEQIVKASEISKNAGADFVKTSTGFGPGGATAEDISLMRKTVGPAMGVKASGGIRTGEDADTMVKAGATRIGASASVAIVTGGKSDSKY